jgi:hypothetical protein
VHSVAYAKALHTCVSFDAVQAFCVPTKRTSLRKQIILNIRQLGTKGTVVKQQTDQRTALKLRSQWLQLVFCTTQLDSDNWKPTVVGDGTFIDTCR